MQKRMQTIPGGRREYHALPGNAVLSLTIRGEGAEAHIWAGADCEDCHVLTGAGFWAVMDTVKSAFRASGARTLMIAACDDRRQRVFERYARKCGGQQIAGNDPDGDPCLLWVF